MGGRGLARAQKTPYQILIIDRMLPEMDGLTIVQTLRQNGVTVPVLVLSALASVDDRVHGLKAGGDDYLTKPFAFAELLARLESLHRRSKEGEVVTKLKLLDLELDLLGRTVKRGGVEIDLQPREFQLPGILDAQSGSCGHALDVDGEGLGLSLRPPDQCDRCPHQPVAAKDRPRF